MNAEKKNIGRVTMIGMAMALLCSRTFGADSSTRTITDMAGRKVTIPVHITKVLSTSPPPTTFVYMLAPEKLGAWMVSFSKDSEKFIPEVYRAKPRFHWSRGSVNVEAYIAAKPDLVFVGTDSGQDASGKKSISEISGVELSQAKFGSLPLVCVDNIRNAADYAETLRFMGEVLGVPDRAQRLIDYYEGVLAEVQTAVAAIPEEQRVRVYYAEGNDGLATDSSGSFHSQLIDICGGNNVAECDFNSGSGRTPVTKESVLMWKPDVIITTSSEFAAYGPDDETWQLVPAVQQQRIYLTPNKPFNWFDRPPGVNRIVGIPWTAHVLYPELFSEAWIRAKVAEFYDLFYHCQLNEADLQELLHP